MDLTGMDHRLFKDRATLARRNVRSLMRRYRKGRSVTKNSIVIQILSAVLICSCSANGQHTDFRPGKIWEDNNGEHINAHGGGVMIYKGTYYIGSDCTGWVPNAARSAWAPGIWGPWTELGKPCLGNDSATTHHSQSTFILPLRDKKDAFIFMGDRWTPDYAIDGRYIWLPVQFESGRPVLEWFDRWGLDFFDK